MTYDPEVEKYRQMQARYYGSVPPTDDSMKNHVVGCFEEHEKYPYERYLLEKFPNNGQEGVLNWLLGVTALDFGCGPGRMILRMSNRFARVDGVDISPTCIATAERWTQHLVHKPRLYVNDGVVLNGVPSEEYDFVYSTIAFHHINPYDIRISLLGEFFRVLKPGGRLAIQMFYTTTPRQDWHQHTSWRESFHDAPMTNGYYDVRITPENTAEVKEDLEKIGFVDVDFRIAPYPPPPHPRGPSETDWIFIHAKKP